MRGEDLRGAGLFSYVDLEAQVPADHPLRAIRVLVDEALAALSGISRFCMRRRGGPLGADGGGEGDPCAFAPGHRRVDGAARGRPSRGGARGDELRPVYLLSRARSRELGRTGVPHRWTAPRQRRARPSGRDPGVLTTMAFESPKPEPDPFPMTGEAKAEAEAIRLVNAQLERSPRYIELARAKRWNGVLPAAMVGTSVTPLMSIK